MASSIPWSSVAETAARPTPHRAPLGNIQRYVSPETRAFILHSVIVWCYCDFVRHRVESRGLRFTRARSTPSLKTTNITHGNVGTDIWIVQKGAGAKSGPSNSRRLLIATPTFSSTRCMHGGLLNDMCAINLFRPIVPAFPMREML